MCKCARYCKKVKPDKYEIFEDRLTAFIDAFGENEEIPTVNENSSELVQVERLPEITLLGLSNVIHLKFKKGKARWCCM